MIGIVVNPVSGGGRGRELASGAARELEAHGLETRAYFSGAEGGVAEETGRALSDGCDEIACIGGDGSLSEAVSVLCGAEAGLLIVPAGSGNDFARTLGLPQDPMEALRAQLDGVPARIDCGMLNGRPFINVSGFGLDAQVLERAEALKEAYPGGKAYRRAVSDVIAHFEPFSPEIRIDGALLEPGRYTIVEAANGRYFGGGMKVAPGADAEDGLFDVVLVRAVPKALIPALLPAFILGWHVRLRLAKVIRAKTVCVRSPGMTVNIDGRLEKMDEARYEICPGGLRVRLPGNRARRGTGEAGRTER